MIAKCRALDVLHRDEVAARVGDADLVDHADVWMIEGRGGTSFLFKTKDTTRISGEFLCDEFKRDVGAELRVTCEIDLAHPAGAEWTEDLVAFHCLTGYKFARLTGKHAGGKFVCRGS